ncbi:SubName: Full=Uncharacterized protein {ECO:0000313/EMBL:CCA72356.1} [Serendipita indica DSM 11827]|uniref:C2H2-type domain-containing protein n=1 Tax=Serendipita indica (strain DSM 11827) TaxID=1109443 RepID=G4TM13_SERID|nr:SubName: Full=Uncharacterized protein {ECO:0000313/EMBL:CCA72356.1} [Serendipita indica DSM 11827]CCA72356.1 hypothetical protein PIIN_06290 [Serendipita indica DSM 11827]
MDKSWKRSTWRASWAYSHRTSAISSEPSVNVCITTSQPSTPVASPRPKRYTWDRSIRTSQLYIGDNIIASLLSLDGDTKPPSDWQRSLTNATSPPVVTSSQKPPESPLVDDSTPTVHVAPAGRNSLEREIDVNPKDQEALAMAINLLSLNHEPPTSAKRNQFPTWRTSTIKNFQFPEPATRALYALVTNSFTPGQLLAAGQIRRFLNNHPADPIPTYLVAEEIAEIHGEHGWCLIGKCGLARISSKFTRLSSTGTDERLDDPPRRQIQALCDHIRDVHFQQLPFTCHLCPVSFRGEGELDRHLRTHPLGDFECTVCGEILYSNELRRRHRSKHTKQNKFLRLLTKVIPLR